MYKREEDSSIVDGGLHARDEIQGIAAEFGNNESGSIKLRNLSVITSEEL